MAFSHLGEKIRAAPEKVAREKGKEKPKNPGKTIL